MSQLQVAHIDCAFDSTPVVSDLSFELADGEIACLLGPSGCGKTTVLRAICGLHALNAGSISVAGRRLSDEHQQVAPEQRQIGMVFQDYALFPHMTVAANVGFGLNKLSKEARQERVNEQLSRVKLQDFAERYPHELSGGQAQRVALARALAPQPKLLLLDEAFSSLDIELRRSLALEVRQLLKRLGITAILVTHDQQEAFAFADKIGVMRDGRILQWDTPYNLYHQPASRRVAEFIGQGVFLPGHAIDARSVHTELGSIEGHREYTWLAQTPVDVLLRPDDIVYDPDGSTAQVVNKLFAGAATLYTLQLPTGSQIQSLLPSHLEFDIGDSIGVRVEADHLIGFEKRVQAPTVASPPIK